MSQSNLIELSYFDPAQGVRLTAYADTIVTENDGKHKTTSAIRFGGYPEMVRGMADAIYGGATIEAIQNGAVIPLESRLKSYRRQMSHDGLYATATLMASDDMQEADTSEDSKEETAEEQAADEAAKPSQPRKCYIFCPEGDRDRLFEELDRKTAAPLIPEFRDYVLDSLISKGDLRPLEVFSIKERLDAWVLNLLPEDKNVVDILEQGLADGSIVVPGSVPDQPDGFEEVENVTGYLNTFGVTVADRIRNQFQPLFDPASEPLSEEVLAVNDYIQEKAGYSLYDAQLAVAEAVKRQLDRKSAALIIAECGSGKTKIGSTALGALHGLWASQHRKGEGKTFGVVMSPSHVTQKWVREIGETLPNTYAMVVRSLTDLDRLYAMYETGDKSVYAVLSKEKARDGYMRYPAVTWNQRQRAFLCPDCMKPVQMEISDDGVRYMVNADQFFFQKEHKKNHKCPNCGSVLWAPVNPGKRLAWDLLRNSPYRSASGFAENCAGREISSLSGRIRSAGFRPEKNGAPAGAQRSGSSGERRKEWSGRSPRRQAGTQQSGISSDERPGRRYGGALWYGKAVRRHDGHADQRLQLRYLPSAVPDRPRPDAEGRQTIPQAQRF